MIAIPFPPAMSGLWPAGLSGPTLADGGGLDVATEIAGATFAQALGSTAPVPILPTGPAIASAPAFSTSIAQPFAPARAVLAPIVSPFALALQAQAGVAASSAGTMTDAATMVKAGAPLPISLPESGNLVDSLPFAALPMHAVLKPAGIVPVEPAAPSDDPVVTRTAAGCTACAPDLVVPDAGPIPPLALSAIDPPVAASKVPIVRPASPARAVVDATPAPATMPQGDPAAPAMGNAPPTASADSPRSSGRARTGQPAASVASPEEPDDLAAIDLTPPSATPQILPPPTPALTPVSTPMLMPSAPPPIAVATAATAATAAMPVATAAQDVAPEPAEPSPGATDISSVDDAMSGPTTASAENPISVVSGPVVSGPVLATPVATATDAGAVDAAISMPSIRTAAKPPRHPVARERATPSTPSTSALTQAPAPTPATPPRVRPEPTASPIAEPTATADRTVAAIPGRIGRQMGVIIARHLVASAGETLTVRLDPIALGRIEVKLAFDEGRTLRAVVAADSPAALDMLRRDSGDLGRALADAGVRADGQSLRFEDRPVGGGGSGADSGGRSGQQPRTPPPDYRMEDRSGDDAAPDDIPRPPPARVGIDLMA